MVESGLIDVESSQTDTLSSPIKLEPGTSINSPPTDFENLIDRRPTSVDGSKAKSSGSLSPPISTAAVISSPSSSFSSLPKGPNGQLKLKSSNVLQQMDIDDGPNAALLAAMKYPLSMENKLINKVKIVVDNISGGANALKNRMEVDASSYHVLQPPPFGIHQSPFHGYNFHSNFHLYEFNQNNQNFLNQHRPDGNPDNQIDESMWRPW